MSPNMLLHLSLVVVFLLINIGIFVSIYIFYGKNKRNFPDVNDVNVSNFYIVCTILRFLTCVYFFYVHFTFSNIDNIPLLLKIVPLSSVFLGVLLNMITLAANSTDSKKAFIMNNITTVINIISILAIAYIRFLRRN